jgi:hypothetical protein
MSLDKHILFFFFLGKIINFWYKRALMPKLAFKKKKTCSMYKIISLLFILEYELIYRQRCEVKLDLSLLLSLKLGVFGA